MGIAAYAAAAGLAGEGAGGGGVWLDIKLAAIGETAGAGAGSSEGTTSPRKMVLANGSGTDATTLFGGGAGGGADPAAGGRELRVTGLPHVAQKRAWEMRAAPHFTQLAMAAVSHDDSSRVQAPRVRVRRPVTAQKEDATAGDTGPESRVARLEQKLAATMQRLQADRMASMGTLAAGLAHEVNNPLGFTLANVTFALEELRLMDEDLAPRESETTGELEGRLARARVRVQAAVDALQEARLGTDRVRLLVRDLKTFAGADVERREPVDVRRVLESAINMAYNAIRLRARLVKDYRIAALVDGNEACLAQVFLNLLLNAAEATREGDAEHQEIRVVLLSAAAGSCIVEVSDTGRGIAPEDLGHVFDPFFTTKPGNGTGLGLAMSHTIVADLGGGIVVESSVGKGSTFRVTLPLSKTEAKPASSKRPPANAPRRARVLVVDDEAMMGRAVQRLLAGEHDVETTTDPPAAVARVRAGERFDVILCDLMMPGMTGMDVYEAVVAIDAEQARRMVFMTGGAFASRAVQFLERVENPRVEKPLDRAALRALIRGQLAP